MTRFVDANVFIRALVRDDEEKWKRSAALFDRAERGGEKLATSESVVAEVVYVLSSPALYRLPRAEVATSVRPFVESRAIQIENRAAMLNALERYESSTLDFEDCLSVEHTLRGHLDAIYSYDRGFDRHPEITRIEP